jgi:RNase P subunit RPR2
MSPILTGVVLAAATAAIILILVLTARRRVDSSSTPAQSAGRKESPMDAVRRRPCPVCGALLAPGERVHSILRFSSTHVRVMEISGCPQCLPPSTRRRTCPVCKAELEPSDILTARYTEGSRERAKPHVHVLGCTRCMR